MSLQRMSLQHGDAGDRKVPELILMDLQMPVCLMLREEKEKRRDRERDRERKRKRGVICIE